MEHVWVEPEGPEGLIEGAPRPPDLWQFELPARVHAAVELTEEMQGRISRLDASGASADLGFVPPGRAWKGELEPGRYQVAAVCSRRNSNPWVRRLTSRRSFNPRAQPQTCGPNCAAQGSAPAG